MLRRIAALTVLAILLSACTGSSPGPGPEATVTAVLDLAIGQSAVRAPEAAPAPAGPKRKVVVLDPGHGGDEVGSAAFGVNEKESNLDFAFRVKELLLAEGIDVVLTRRTDERAAAQIPGFTATRSDLQARIDLANDAGGSVFVSLHSNGSSDTTQRGVEVWYDSTRAFAGEGQLLAGLLKDRVLSRLHAFGYAAQDRGLYDGACFRQREGRCFTLFVIAGPRMTTREEVLRRGGDPESLGFKGQDVLYSVPANMPAALVELLIITNPADAAVLRSEAARHEIARGVADAILEFLASQPSS